MDPKDVWVHTGLGWVYGQKKMYPEAIAELEKAVSLSARHEKPLASLGEVLAESGRKREAAQILAELKLRSKYRYVSPCLIALVQLGLGERDQGDRVTGAGVREPRPMDALPESRPAPG